MEIVKHRVISSLSAMQIEQNANEDSKITAPVIAYVQSL